jgi:hypothetical protein
MAEIAKKRPTVRDSNGGKRGKMDKDIETPGERRKGGL